MLSVGDKIPEFEAIDSEGTPVSPEDLLGSITVLYFYPKDDTPGCTKEACDFRDKMHELDTRGIIILGCSPDGLASHQKFIDKHGLNFTLLADETKELCEKFDVLKEKDMAGKHFVGVERTTFIIDEKGIIRWIERPAQVEGHIDRIIHIIDQIQGL